MKLFATRLKQITAKDKYNRIVFRKGKGRRLYLVGGYIRDAFMGIDSSDRDYIVDGDILSLASDIRNALGGTLVAFKNEGFIRLVLKNGLTLDFSQMQGSLKDDLSGRDFSMNAIAWSPEEGIIDLHGGIPDINKRTIRCIHRKNLLADPLRILRAYRFAAQYRCSIRELTREQIKSLKNKLIKVSPERITLELSHLLNSDTSAKYLEMALSDGVLTAILPMNSRQLGMNIRDIAKLERRLRKVYTLKIKVILNKKFSQNLIYKGLLTLEMLLQKTKPSQRIALKHLKLSSRTKKRLLLVHKGIYLISNSKNLRRQLFDLFMFTKEATTDVLILTDSMDLLPEFERFNSIWKTGLLTPDQIMDVTGIQSGPEIGQIIYQTRKAHFEKKIRTQKQAIQFMKELI